MKTRIGCAMVTLVCITLSSGCTVSNVDFTTIEKPKRSSEMDRFDVFVGSWAWEAELKNTEGPDRKWTGNAQWDWTLDKRCLQGKMSAKSHNVSFDAEGVWSWHPKKKKYIWWMFNNWGYPQEGTAKYNATCNCWCMNYKSVGLDGTTSYGRHTIQVKDNDTLDWRMEEWVDALHLIKKSEMRGTYKRTK